jgi:hypothetical protein
MRIFPLSIAVSLPSKVLSDYIAHVLYGNHIPTPTPMEISVAIQRSDKKLFIIQSSCLCYTSLSPLLIIIHLTWGYSELKYSQYIIYSV